MRHVSRHLIAFCTAAFALPAAAHDDDHKHASSVVIEDFGDDFGDPRHERDHEHDPRKRPFVVRGPAGAFQWDARSRPHYEGDHRGSLVATYDSAAPTARLYTTFDRAFTEADDFVFGAVLTIEPGDFHADPDAAAQMSFSLFNSRTTGDNRTGDLSHFASDSYDTVETTYFPNVSTLYGGPFLAPTVLGSRVGDDAFNNIGFASTQVAMVPGVPYLVMATHDARAHAHRQALHAARPRRRRRARRQ